MFHKKSKLKIENNFAKGEWKRMMWSFTQLFGVPLTWGRKGRQVNWKETTLKLQPSLQGILYVGVSHSKHNKLCTFQRKKDGLWKKEKSIVKLKVFC